MDLKPVFYILSIGVMAALCTAAGAQEAGDSISQYGITWRFDRPLTADGAGETYQYGRFVNGDYWIVGPVNVIDVTPRTAVCTPEQRGDAEADDDVWRAMPGYIWWAGQYWCITPQLGDESGDWVWKRHHHEPLGEYEYYYMGRRRSDRKFDVSGITRSFSNYEQDGEYEGDIYFSEGSGRWTWNNGVFLETDETYNGKPVFRRGHVMHGSMASPESGGHGFDSHQSGFDLTLTKEFPAEIPINTSLLSARSYETAGNTTGITGDNQYWAMTRSSTETVAVLTVLPEAPPDNSFRPPFYGTEKPLYSADDINWDALPRLLPPQYDENPEYDFEDIYAARGRPAEYPTIADQYGRYFQRPWLFFSAVRATHPRMNMPAYHREVWRTFSSAAVLLCIDLDTIYESEGEMEKIVIPFIQVGIDTHYTNINQRKSTHCSRWPTIFAGIMLGDEELKTMATGNRWVTGYVDRSERKTYYREDARSDFESEVVPPDEFYHGFDAGHRQQYTNEHEHLDPATEWGTEYGTGSGSGGTTRETYRHINSPGYVGHALAAHLMNAKNLWDHPPFFDYVIRWMILEPEWEGLHENVRQSEGNSCSGFVNEMFDRYNWHSPETGSGGGEDDGPSEP